MPELSRRAAALGTENAFVVLAEVNQLIRAGRDVISLCIGQPDFSTPAHIQDAAIEAIRGGRHGYTPSAGIDELRAAAAASMAKLRGIAIAPEDVVVGAGAKPFIAYAIASTTDYGAGDEVIFPVPGFPIYGSQVRANGAAPVALPLRASRAFAFDPQELAARITPRTKLLILNSPQNPTEVLLARRDLEAIAAVLAKHPQVWVYADQIYSKLVYDGEFVSIASLPGMQERTISSDGASKTYAMTGWRIVFTANRALAPVFTRWITNTESCASQISQWAALTGPQGEAEKIRALPRAARSDRAAAERRAGFSLRLAGRRVLRVAQRDRSLRADRRAGPGGAAQAAAARGGGGCARRHPLRAAHRRRGPAHPLFLCGKRSGDRSRCGAHRRFRSPSGPLSANP